MLLITKLDCSHARFHILPEEASGAHFHGAKCLQEAA